MFKLFDFSLRINGFPIKKAKDEFKKILAISDEKFEDYVIKKRNLLCDYHDEQRQAFKDTWKDIMDKYN